LDAQTSGRVPSAEKPKSPQRQPEQSPADKARKTGERSREGGASRQSFRQRLREHWMLATGAVCLLLIALIGGIAYWLAVRGYESTDDAFIAARSFSVAPKVGGYVVEVPVTDNQHVNAGDLVARIDDRDYKTSVDQAQAQLAVSQASIANIQAQTDSQRQQIDQAKAQLDQAQAQLQFSQQEEARAKDLVDRGAGTVQREQQTRSDLLGQQANTARARAALTAHRRAYLLMLSSLGCPRGGLREEPDPAGWAAVQAVTGLS